MDKHKILMQLESLKREHAKTKQKLERSDKVAKRKAHIRQKLREQTDVNQSFDGLSENNKDERDAETITRKSNRIRNRSVSFKLDRDSQENKSPTTHHASVIHVKELKNISEKLCDNSSPAIKTDKLHSIVHQSSALVVKDTLISDVKDQNISPKFSQCDNHVNKKIKLDVGSSILVSSSNERSSNNPISVDDSDNQHNAKEFSKPAVLNISKLEDNVNVSFSCTQETKPKLDDQDEEIRESVVDALMNNSRDGDISSIDFEDDKSNIPCEKNDEKAIKCVSFDNSHGESSTEWTQMDIGDDVLDDLQLYDGQRPVLSHLTYCKTIQVNEDPILNIHCSTICWEGQLCEAVICSTQASVNVWYYGRSGTDIWRECAVQQWVCPQDEHIDETHLVSESHSSYLSLLLCGAFNISKISLLVFTGGVQVVPLCGYSSKHLACVVNPWSVIIASLGGSFTELHRVVLVEDYTGCDDTCQLHDAPDALNSLSCVQGSKVALVGASQDFVHIWNWESGQLLMSIPQCTTDTVKIACTGGAIYQAGLFYVLLYTASTINFIVANPNTAKSEIVQSYRVNDDRVSSVQIHGGYLLSVTEKGAVKIWDTEHGQLVGENITCKFSSATYHPEKPVLLCGTKTGEIHVFVRNR